MKRVICSVLFSALSVCFFCAGAFAITIDDFDGGQTVKVEDADPTPRPVTVASTVSSATAIGGYRYAEIKSFFIPTVNVVVGGGKFSHSQDYKGLSEARVIWNKNGAGLGGVDLLVDGATKFEFVGAGVDFGTIDITLWIIDTGSNLSWGKVAISEGTPVVTPSILFSALVGAANLRSVRSIEMVVQPQLAAQDLSIGQLRTDGACEEAPQGLLICPGCDNVSMSGKVIDACGVCEGDGHSYLGCKEIDTVSIIKSMQKSVKKQERFNKRYVEKLGANATLTIKVSGLSTTYYSEAVANTDQLPTSIQQCSNTTYCTDTALGVNLDAYLKNVRKLYKLARRTILNTGNPEPGPCKGSIQECQANLEARMAAKKALIKRARKLRKKSMTNAKKYPFMPVSYTHLTLPTIYSV